MALPTLRRSDKNWFRATRPRRGFRLGPVRRDPYSFIKWGRHRGPNTPETATCISLTRSWAKVLWTFYSSTPGYTTRGRLGLSRLRPLSEKAELLGRLIHFDRRGTGLSDPVPPTQLPSLDEQVGDAMAVMRAAGSREAVLIGINDGTIIASLLAAQHSDLCRSLISSR